MISKSLSTSEKRASLHRVAGRLAEFAQALYPLIVVHADDFGRLQGDLLTVKHTIDPTSPRKTDDFARALLALHEVGLIQWYVGPGGRPFIEVTSFDDHQTGLHKRTKSRFPGPSGKLPEIPSQRTEQNRRERNGTELRTAAPPQHVTVPDADPDPESHYAVITALVGKEILPLRLPDPELMQATKDRCEELKITYTPETVRKAVDSALFRYYRQMRRDFELPADPRGIFHDSDETRH